MLEGLQRLLWYIQVYEKRFAQEQMERFGLQEKKELTAKRRELDNAKRRVVEIDQGPAVRGTFCHADGITGK